MRYNCMLDFNAYHTRDPNICNGEPVVKGTRVTIRTHLASLAEGMEFEEILEDFPTVSQEGLRAVIAFAAASAGEDSPVSSIPSTSIS